MKRGFLIFAVLLASATLQAERFFVSNALGMPIEEIQEYRTDEYPYVLHILPGEDLTLKILYRDQKEYKKWELSFSGGTLVAEALYFEGELRESLHYESGRLVVEIFYEGDFVEEKRSYKYENGELQEVLAVDRDGEVLYRDVYERSASGRLRKIRRASDEMTESSAFTYAQGKLVQEWHGKDEEGILYRYHDGEQLAEETWEGLKLLLAEEVKMHEGRKEVVKVDNFVGTVTTDYYDEEDRIAIARTLADDELIEHVRFEYDDDDVLKQETHITRSSKVDRVYDYDDSGELIRETHFRNTWIVKVVEYTGENTYFEEIYRDGVPSLRVYFEDGKKVDEIFLRTPVRDE